MLFAVPENRGQKQPREEYSCDIMARTLAQRTAPTTEVGDSIPRAQRR